MQDQVRNPNHDEYDGQKQHDEWCDNTLKTLDKVVRALDSMRFDAANIRRELRVEQRTRELSAL